MLTDIADSIESWKGVDLRLCQKEKQSFRQYKRTLLIGIIEINKILVHISFIH